MSLANSLIFSVMLAMATCQAPAKSWEHLAHELPLQLRPARAENPAFHSDDFHVTPEIEEIPGNALPTNGQEEPVVGAGLPAAGLSILPVLNWNLGTMAAGVKAKGAANLALAEANALALKHKAEMDKALIDVKLKNDLLASKARMAGQKMLFNSAILGVDRSAGPEDAPDAINEEIDNEMKGVSFGEKSGLPEFVSRLNEMFGKPAVKREIAPEMNFRGHHMKRDEDLFVWGLNNFERQASNPAERVGLTGPHDLDLTQHHSAGVSLDPLEDREVLKPVAEVKSNSMPDSNDFASGMENGPKSVRMHPRHFGHLHKKYFGLHTGNDGFQSNAQGSFAPGVADLVKPFGPTEITINNQQNTFTNSVPSSTGNTNFQISQSTGQAGSSQSHAASNHRNPHDHGHGHDGFRQAHADQQTFTQGFERAEEMHLADHFLGMRSLMPINSGSIMAMVPPRTRRIKPRAINTDYSKRIKHDISKELAYLNHIQDDIFETNFLQMMQNSHPTKVKDKSSIRRRRSLPLIRLAMDPNAKLNMPKTLENLGTIARNSFEDKHAPMYHVHNMFGSIKNAFLSGLRIAPQDLIIPSQYRIIDTKEEMVMKPADIEAIKIRAAADATAEAEARAARQRDVERRREAFSPPKPFEVIKAPPSVDFSSKLEDWKALGDKLFKPISTKPIARHFDESALRRKAFGLGEANAPLLGSRMAIDNNEADPFDFLKTFQKVGAVVRSSIKSGQETIQHISDAAHSARKAYHTARFGAPRVLLPYARAPVVDNDNKLMFITPRFLDVDKDEPLARTVEPPMIEMGEIMNAFGVANPEARTVQKQRIIVEKSALPHPGKVPIFESRFSDAENAANPLLKPFGKVDNYYIYAEDIDEEPAQNLKLDDAFQSLQSLKDIVGPKTITEFLEEMKEDFTSLQTTQKTEEIQNLKNKLNDVELSSRIGKTEVEDDTELKQFLNDLFAEQTTKIGENENTPDAVNKAQGQSQSIPGSIEEKSVKENDIVGSKLFLPQNLLKPFMNQPNTEQLNEYFRENGDFEEIKDDPNKDFNNFLRMHALVAAINPEMYQELFNQSYNTTSNLTIPQLENFFNIPSSESRNKQDLIDSSNNTNFSRMDSSVLQKAVENSYKDNIEDKDMLNNVELNPTQEDLQRLRENESRTSMHFPEPLLKPYLGKHKPKNEYYYDYGYDDSY